jgi:hypothetical protein
MNRVLHTFIVLLCCLVVQGCKKDEGPAQPPAPDYGTPTAVGTPIGSPSTATIGAAGGALLSPDGRSEIVIPPGALSASTQISIQPVTNAAPGGAGVGFYLTPHGQVFNQPVTLRFHYDSTDVAGTSIHALSVATQKDDHIWYSFDALSLDSAARTVSVSTTHFSGYSLFKNFFIFPDHNDIRVLASLSIQVIGVRKAPNDPDPHDGLTPRGGTQMYPSGNDVRWTVNGIPDGNASEGYIVPTRGSATTTYTAPETKQHMFSNPAAVTAEVAFPGSSRLLLISYIKVLDGRAYRVSLDLAGTNISLSPYFVFDYSDHAEYIATVYDNVTRVDVSSLVNSHGQIESLTLTGSCTATPVNQGDLLNIHDVVGFAALDSLLLQNPSTFTFFPYTYDCGNGTQTSGGSTFEGDYVMPFFRLDSTVHTFTITGLQTAGEVVTITVTPQPSDARKARR